MCNVIENKSFDEERSLYGISNSIIKNCVFAGPSDGESALKECRDIEVTDCAFSLRYPLWHTHNYRVIGSTLDEGVRAPLWYSSDGMIQNCRINGIKCLRECDRTEIINSEIISAEFGWRCRDVVMTKCRAESEYFLFDSRNVKINNLEMRGKYSFQYAQNMTITDSVLDTKDAFWHSKNVTVENSVIKGEYLGWYSENLVLKDCRIIGTQPLCYCNGLKIINCTMEDTDLSFEYSDVEADIKGDIVSVKNPKSGNICADSIGQIILCDSVMPCECNIHERNK